MIEEVEVAVVLLEAPSKEMKPASRLDRQARGQREPKRPTTGARVGEATAVAQIIDPLLAKLRAMERKK